MRDGRLLGGPRRERLPSGATLRRHRTNPRGRRGGRHGCVYADQTVTLDTHREHITFAPFTAPDPVTTPWDPIQVAYFTSAAVWNYLTEPFGFTYSGVDAREIEPWDEHGQRWRRLAVTFPRTNANHIPEQVFYFDESFMQRRMDYSPHVTGNTATPIRPSRGSRSTSTRSCWSAGDDSRRRGGTPTPRRGGLASADH
jgi:hypothetical protein